MLKYLEKVFSTLTFDTINTIDWKQSSGYDPQELKN